VRYDRNPFETVLDRHKPTAAWQPGSPDTVTLARFLERNNVSGFHEVLVEAAGVEPASEKVWREKTTCVSGSVVFDRCIGYRQEAAA